MGFQLWPTGIGWRAFSRTVETGLFDCQNPRCKGKAKAATQEYRLRTQRTWFTVLFIPVIPLGGAGAYVECRSCKSVFPTSVLTQQRRRGSIEVEAARVVEVAPVATPQAVAPQQVPALAMWPAAAEAAPALVSSAPSTNQAMAALPDLRTAVAATASPNEGWYTDPMHEASLRWWDGHSWTGHVSN